MDDIDRAQQREQMDRDLAISAAAASASAHKTSDLPGEICTGCDYATRTNFGKTCEAWTECLHDLQRRERATP